RKKRNFLATLLLSQGVPMLLAGDEISHTKQGNNNTYCHDNELTWINWELDEQQQELFEFVQRLTALAHEEPVFQRRRFFYRIDTAEGLGPHPEIAWLAPNGKHMEPSDWSQ